MKRVVILIGSELRHDYVRMVVARTQGVTVLRSFCEGKRGAPKIEIEGDGADAEVQRRHLALRRASEEEFFGSFVRTVEDQSHPMFVCRGAVNEADVADEICELEPDLLLGFGCSIVREPLLTRFRGRFLNAHLGLSPYYRGSGTNFWALVNGEPEFVGCTFMHMDVRVDAGRIIHQIRARVVAGDTPHTIGNRLISDMAETYGRIAARFDEIEDVAQPPRPETERYYRRRDFGGDAVHTLYRQFDRGLVARYLNEKEERCVAAIIISNQIFAQEA